MENIITALNRRYATNMYDTTKKVSESDLTTILEAMRLAPSSFGLQPWKFIVVANPEKRQQILDNSRGQTKVTEASHLIAIAAKKNLTEEDVDTYMNSIATTRNIPVEGLAWFKWMIMWVISNKDQASIQTWNAKQTYIALGFGLVAAATLGIDASPMEWFAADKVDEILGLTDYTTITLMPIWYRSIDDQSQHYAKVRFPMDQIIETK